MVKKSVRLSSEAAKKTSGYIPGGLESLLKTVSKVEQEGKIVRLNFEISESLKNEFKSKAAKQGKKIKNVLIELVENYIKNC